MQITIYLDVLGLLNFGSDFMILFLTGLILRKRIVIWRILLGAMLGTVFLMPVLFLPAFFSGTMRILACLMGSLGTAAITYGERGRLLLGVWMVEICVMFCIGGVMYGIRCAAGMQGMTFAGWALSFVAGSLAILCLFRNLGSMGQGLESIFCIRIMQGDRHIEEQVYLDTGNMLMDPLFGKPVILLTEQAASRLMTDEEQKLVREYQKHGRLSYDRLAVCGSQRKLCFHELSYRSVGRQGGKLLCFLAEKVEVCERKKILKAQPVAIVASELFEGMAYQGLLHRECISGRI